MLKGLPCFVSKGQHSKHEKFEVQTMRPPQTLDSRRRRGATTCPGEAVTRSLLLPYRPRHRAAARRRPLAPRCAAPWRGAPGTAETERRRVGAQRRAPAGRSTITAFSALSWRPRQPEPTADGRCLEAAGSGPFSKEARPGVSLSPRAGALPAPGFSPTQAQGRSARLALSAPAPPSSASASIPPQLYRERFPRAPQLPPGQPPPKGQAPCSPPSAEAAPALGSRPGGAGLWGRLGPRGTRQPPAVASRRASQAPFVCAPPSPLRSPFSGAALGARESERKRPGQARDWKGAKGDSTYSGKIPACCCLWAPRGLAPTPASPPRQRPGRGGTGEERSRWDRVGNGASGAAGKGLKNCFGFAREI